TAAGTAVCRGALLLPAGPLTRSPRLPAAGLLRWCPLLAVPGSVLTTQPVRTVRGDIILRRAAVRPVRRKGALGLGPRLGRNGPLGRLRRLGTRRAPGRSLVLGTASGCRPGAWCSGGREGVLGPSAAVLAVAPVALAVPHRGTEHRRPLGLRLLRHHRGRRGLGR